MGFENGSCSHQCSENAVFVGFLGLDFPYESVRGQEKTGQGLESGGNVCGVFWLSRIANRFSMLCRFLLSRLLSSASLLLSSDAIYGANLSYLSFFIPAAALETSCHRVLLYCFSVKSTISWSLYAKRCGKTLPMPLPVPGINCTATLSLCLNSSSSRCALAIGIKPVIEEFVVDVVDVAGDFPPFYTRGCPLFILSFSSKRRKELPHLPHLPQAVRHLCLCVAGRKNYLPHLPQYAIKWVPVPTLIYRQRPEQKSVPRLSIYTAPKYLNSCHDHEAQRLQHVSVKVEFGSNAYQ